MSMKQGGMVKNPFQTELFERLSELSPPSGNFPEGLATRRSTSGDSGASLDQLRRSDMSIVNAFPLPLKLRRSGMVCTQQHAAPMGLKRVLFGFACYRHVAPPELGKAAIECQ
jgi:hypothetical protein